MRNSTYKNISSYLLPSSFAVIMLSLVKWPVSAVEWIQNIGSSLDDKTEFNSVFGTQDIDELLFEKRRAKAVAAVPPCNGTGGNDNIPVGGANCDTAYGLGGNDNIYGSLYNPTLLDGGADNDEFWTSLYAGGQIIGGSGNDYLVVGNYSYSNTNINLGSGTDTLYLWNNDGVTNIQSFLPDGHADLAGYDYFGVNSNGTGTINIKTGNDGGRINLFQGNDINDVNIIGGSGFEYIEADLYGKSTLSANLGDGGSYSDIYSEGYNSYKYGVIYNDIDLTLGAGNHYLNFNTATTDVTINSSGTSNIYQYSTPWSVGYGANNFDINIGSNDDEIDLYSYSNDHSIIINNLGGNDNLDFRLKYADFELDATLGNDSVHLYSRISDGGFSESNIQFQNGNNFGDFLLFNGTNVSNNQLSFGNGDNSLYYTHPYGSRNNTTQVFGNGDNYIYRELGGNEYNNSLSLGNGNNILFQILYHYSYNGNSISMGEGDNYVYTDFNGIDPIDFSFSAGNGNNIVNWYGNSSNRFYGNTNILFGDGNNSFNWDLGYGDLRGNQYVSFGNGNNEVSIIADDVYQLLDLSLGNGNNIFYAYFFDDVDYFNFSSGSGNDTVDIEIDDDLDGYANFSLGNGNNFFTLSIGDTDGDVFIQSESGNDYIYAYFDDIDANTALVTGAGDDLVYWYFDSPDDDGLYTFLSLGSGDDKLYSYFEGVTGEVYAGDGNDTLNIDFDNDRYYNYYYSDNSPLELRVFGEDGNDRILMDNGSDGVIANGGSGNDFIRGGGGNDILIAGSGVDSLIGGGGNDQLHVSDTLFAYAHGGAGVDELHIEFPLKLADNLDRIKSMDKIVLAGESFVTLEVNPASVLAVATGVNGFTITPKTLVVDGKEKDFVAMGNSFKFIKTDNIGTSSYNVYKDSATNANLWVADHLRVGETPPLAIELNKALASINISPNPSSGIVKIDVQSENALGAMQVQVVDLTGKQVYLENWEEASNTLNRSIQLPENLNNGMYFVRVNGNSFNIGKTIILEK